MRTRADLHALARLGAQARIAAIQGEMSELHRQFPGLASTRRGPGRPRNGDVVAAPKRKMSAAARKRIGDAVRKRWAKWRKAQAR